MPKLGMAQNWSIFTFSGLVNTHCCFSWSPADHSVLTCFHPIIATYTCCLLYLWSILEETMCNNGFHYVSLSQETVSQLGIAKDQFHDWHSLWPCEGVDRSTKREDFTQPKCGCHINTYDLIRFNMTQQDFEEIGVLIQRNSFFWTYTSTIQHGTWSTWKADPLGDTCLVEVAVGVHPPSKSFAWGKGPWHRLEAQRCNATVSMPMEMLFYYIHDMIPQQIGQTMAGELEIYVQTQSSPSIINPGQGPFC